MSRQSGASGAGRNGRYAPSFLLGLFRRFSSQDFKSADHCIQFWNSDLQALWVAYCAGVEFPVELRSTNNKEALPATAEQSKDAERYRWLRANAIERSDLDSEYLYLQECPVLVMNCKSEFDAAIAAMQSKAGTA